MKTILTTGLVLLLVAIVSTMWENFQWSARRSRTTPLAMAAKAGDAAQIKRLIRDGAALEEMTGRGETPLILAARAGRIDAIKVLLDAGAAVNAKSGMSAAAEAVESGNPDAVALILDRGASVESQDGIGNTLLYQAAYRGDDAVVKLLLRRGARVKAKGYHGSLLAEAAWGGSLDVMKTLIDHGVEINELDQRSGTPLMSAAQKGDARVVEFLLSRGAQADVKNKAGKTALDIAREFDRPGVVHLLTGR